MTKIITRTGSGAAIDSTDNDGNLSSLSGITEAVTGTTYTVTIDDQNRVLELSNASPIAVTLTDIATIDGATQTDDFKVTLKNIGAGLVTITRGSTDTFDDGSTAITLEQYAYVTIQTDNSLTKWNIINSNKYLVTPSISGITTTDNNIVIDTSGGQKSLTFNGTGDTAILGETNGDLGAYDITNARYIWFYDESANTLTSTATLTATNAALTTPTITSPVLNTGISGTAFLDEDDMVSDSATKAASQQSIKAYVDTQIVAQSPYVYEFSSANVLVSSNKGSFTSAKPSTGVYTVTHNLGTTDYVIIPGVRTDSYNITLISKGANDFQLSIRDAAGTRSDSNYMFSLWDNS